MNTKAMLQLRHSLTDCSISTVASFTIDFKADESPD